MGLPQSEFRGTELLKIAAIQEKQCRLYEIDQSLDNRRLHAAIEKLKANGFHVIYSEKGSLRTLGVIGEPECSPDLALEEISSFLAPLQIIKPYKLASHEFHLNKTVVQIGNNVFGGKNIPLIKVCDDLGCFRKVLSIRDNSFSGTVLIDLALEVYERDVRQSVLEMLENHHRESPDRQLIVRIDSTEVLERISGTADALYIKGEQMQNYNLLQDAGQSLLPVFLERGVRSTIDEWLAAAEYILASGNPNLILSTRGIRTFASEQDQLTMDISSMPVLKTLTHLPVAVDVRSSANSEGQLQAISAAAVAADADALLFTADATRLDPTLKTQQLKLIANSMKRDI